MPSKFVHLHVHSHYSLLQALPKLDALAKAVKEQGMDAVALTDYGAVYGIIEFIQECQKKEIKPIIGQCAYVATDKLTDKRARIDDKQHQLVLLCETMEGYKNLLKLTTIAHLEGFYYKPRIDKDHLRKFGKGLIALSGGLKGEISKALANDEFGKAENIVREYQDILGKDNFFIEIQDHPELDDQVARNRDLIKLSEKTGAPLVATKDVHYLHPEESEAQDILRCIADGVTIDDERRTRMTDADYSFVSAEHMEKAFKDYPEAIENTRRIADRCNVQLELGKWNFAEIGIPEGETHATWLSKQAYEGAARKFPEITEVIKQRLEHELGIINQKGYAPYFLVVSDYMRWAQDQGIMTTTRGSAAGSLVSYCIDIVPVNPLTYNLPFERFLNPFRPSPPDIDGDFEDKRRDEVIAYVTQKYGSDRVAQICTFGTMAARGAVRDVGRALGLPYALCDKISKMIPMGSQGRAMTIAHAIEITPDLREEMKTDPQVERLLALAQKVEGGARQVSVHAAGVVIAPKPLTEYTALQREAGGDKLITQYEMNTIEAAGVLKMDFLGIRNLSILGTAVKIIKRTKNVDIDIRNIPLDDAVTFKMLAEGETTGLFQLNGAGMTRYLKELKPSSIHDIMAMVALFRPGPMESIPEYIRRKHNPSLVTYLVPEMKDITETSYGVITYQDDVLYIAIRIAGYNWEEADKFRKAMGKKIPEEMAKQKEKFFAGCLKHGKLTEQKTQQLWQLIAPFADYGFNKSHACAYGMFAYQTAYLKANWTAEYMTAVLSAESGDADKVAEVIADCAKLGIEVLPPDINESGADFTYIDDKNIRFGLLAIKNLGSDIIDVLIAERKERGSFKHITDLATRVISKNFNKKSLEAMIKSGAMDCLGERNQLLTGIEQIQTHHKSAMKDRDSGQFNLFGAAQLRSDKAEIILRQVPPATKREKLAWERELLGLYVSEHPFKEYADFFGEALVSLSTLPEKKGTKGLIRVGGIVMDVRNIITKKGDPMAFVRLEDISGTVEVVVFPSIYDAVKHVLVKDAPVMVEGKVDEKDGEMKVLCEAAERLTSEGLEDLRQKLNYSRGQSKSSSVDAKSLSIGDNPLVCIAVPPKLPTSLVNELKRVFSENPGGRRVVFVIRNGGVEKRIETPYSIAFSGDTIVAIEKLVGKGAVLA